MERKLLWTSLLACLLLALLCCAAESGDFTIVRTKRFSIKPMTPQEAILQMNLLEHEFYAFLNSEDADAFSVVYRRKNGGYGLITDDKD